VGVRRLIALGVAVAVLVGVVMRIAVLNSRLGVVDGDEAVVGLMARNLLHGHPDTFFWGQSYGGTLGAFIDAPILWLLGRTPIALKVAPMLLDVSAAVLLGLVGRRLAGKSAGVVAALAFWVWPGTYVWWSTKERLFYWPCLVLGLLVLLCALRIDEQPRRWREWLVLGGASGLGWWATPQILYFTLPAALWLVVRHWRLWWGWGLAAAAGLVGAGPWISYNLGHHLDSLDLPPQPYHQGYVDHLSGLVRKGVPMGLGLRVPYSERWLGGSAIAVLYLVVVGVVAYQLVRRRSRPMALLTLAIAFFPFFYAASPFTWFIGEGRYVLFLTAFLTVALAAAVARKPVLSVALVTTLAVVSTAGLFAMRGWTDPFAPDVRVPTQLGPLVAALDRNHVTRLFTDYWIAYRVTFETDQRVVAAPVVASRYSPYDTDVRAAERPAWVAVAGSARIGPFEAALAQRGVAWRRVKAGSYLLYLPDRRVVPEDLPAEVLP
jgi:hypothetical protein